MSLADRQAERPANKYDPGMPCGVANAIALLAATDPTEAKILADMIEDRVGWSARQIWLAVREDHPSIPLAHTSVAHHRRHSCRCYR